MLEAIDGITQADIFGKLGIKHTISLLTGSMMFLGILSDLVFLKYVGVYFILGGLTKICELLQMFWGLPFNPVHLGKFLVGILLLL